MFDRRTVFIVGAGASREVNFPMGAQLTGIIREKLDIRYEDGWKLSKGDRHIVSAVEHICRQNGRQDPNSYYSAGRAIAGAMGQAISIDNYLHSHAHDEDVVLMGKLGITRSIIEAESASLLATNLHNDRHIDFSKTTNSWYNIFFQMLTEGAQRSSLDDVFSNVAFVTFNYDRCIEHYLAHALLNFYGLSTQEAETLVRTLRVEHPYGQVGRLPWQSPQGTISFGKEVQPQDLPEIAHQIQTFTERVQDTDMLKRMRRLISEAEVVVYLGFSYGTMNMDLLSVDQAGNKAVFGTSYGVSEPNKKVIERDIVTSMGAQPDVVTSLDLADMTCVNFLQAYWRPILRG